MSRKRIFEVDLTLVVTKGYYRGKRSHCSYYVDCDTLGRFYFLSDFYCEMSSGFFHESWVSNKYLDCVTQK